MINRSPTYLELPVNVPSRGNKAFVRHLYLDAVDTDSKLFFLIVWIICFTFVNFFDDQISLDNFMSGFLHKLLEYFQSHQCPAPLVTIWTATTSSAQA